METNRNFENVEADEFESRIAKDSTAIILDVRTKEEFSLGSIPGAICSNVMSADFIWDISSFDKNKAVYVYCRSGMRSLSACHILIGKGFKKIINLSGGIINYRGKLNKNKKL